MDQLNYIVQWIAKDIFGVPAYLVGIMTMIALIASSKSLGDIVGGTLKATLGFIILGIGADAVIGALTPLGALITGCLPRQRRRADERGDHGDRQQDPGRRPERRLRDVLRRHPVARDRPADAAALRLPDRPPHAVHGDRADGRPVQRQGQRPRPDRRGGDRPGHDDAHHAGLLDAVDEEGHGRRGRRDGPLRDVRLHRCRRHRPDRRPGQPEHRGDGVPAGAPLPPRPDGRHGRRDDLHLPAAGDHLHDPRRRDGRHHAVTTAWAAAAGAARAA